MENTLSFQSNTGVGRISPKVYGREGPIIILLHSIKDHSERYIAFAQAMENCRIRTVLFDLPGHGSCIEKEEDRCNYG